MIVYLIIINLISFILMGYDKYLSINNNYRISEKIFFLLTLMGSFIGIFLAIFLFRHKNKKLSFKLIIMIMFLLNIILFYVNKGLFT